MVEAPTLQLLRRMPSAVRLLGLAVTLALAAAWELLAGRLGVTEAELVEKMRELDQRDGVVDGRRTPPVGRRCPSCDAVIPPGATACQFCGQQVGGDDPFR